MGFQSRLTWENKYLKYCCDLGILIFWKVMSDQISLEWSFAKAAIMLLFRKCRQSTVPQK